MRTLELVINITYDFNNECFENFTTSETTAHAEKLLEQKRAEAPLAGTYQLVGIPVEELPESERTFKGMQKMAKELDLYYASPWFSAFMPKEGRAIIGHYPIMDGKNLFVVGTTKRKGVLTIVTHYVYPEKRLTPGDTVYFEKK